MTEEDKYGLMNSLSLIIIDKSWINISLSQGSCYIFPFDNTVKMLWFELNQ